MVHTEYLCGTSHCYDVNVAESLEILEDRAIFGEWRKNRTVKKRSLDRARAFSGALGLASDVAGVSILGIVGSKGKGTAAAYASAALAGLGVRTGTIMSPALLTNRDRIRIDGRSLSERVYVDFLERIIQARKTLPPVARHDGYLSPTGTYTLAGASTLIDQGCEVLVVEAGLGGARDEISLFGLDVVILTEIFCEHVGILGPTVLDIARDKLGVITGDTRAVVSVSQSPVVEREIARTCEKTGAQRVNIDLSSRSAIIGWLPPEYGRFNALAGVQAATVLFSLLGRAPAGERDLESALRSVNHPGRLSRHQCGGADIIVDSAISRNGLVSAVTYAAHQFDGMPDRILVSLPADKELASFVAELRHVECERIFVGLTREHLSYPSEEEWPWNWVQEDGLHEELLSSGRVLAVGTVSFVTAVLQVIGVDVEYLFTVPSRDGC